MTASQPAGMRRFLIVCGDTAGAAAAARTRELPDRNVRFGRR
jgi:hypothetical protein